MSLLLEAVHENLLSSASFKEYEQLLEEKNIEEGAWFILGNAVVELGVQKFEDITVEAVVSPDGKTFRLLDNGKNTQLLNQLKQAGGILTLASTLMKIRILEKDTVEMFCRECGKSFLRKLGKVGRPQLFCTTRCMNTASIRRYRERKKSKV